MRRRDGYRPPGRLYWAVVILAALAGIGGIVYQVERDLAVWRHCR